MNKIVLGLVIAVLTSNAWARDSNQTPLFQCGVKLGGQQLTYQPASEQKKIRDTLFDNIAGSAKVASLRLASFDSGTASSVTDKPTQPSTVDTRLPPKFTFATFGCSWR